MVKKSKEVVIVSASRTPIGAYRGSLKKMRSDQLGSIVIKEVLKRSKFNKDEIDEVVMGQVLTAGMGQNPARQAAINAGISISKPAHMVNQVCGSGLRAVISGYQSIKLGDSLNAFTKRGENLRLNFSIRKNVKSFFNKSTAQTSHGNKNIWFHIEFLIISVVFKCANSIQLWISPSSFNNLYKKQEANVSPAPRTFTSLSINSSGNL